MWWLIAVPLVPFQPAKKADGSKIKSDKAKNVMRDLHIRKLCLNICVGESGDRLTRAAKVRSLGCVVEAVSYLLWSPCPDVHFLERA